MLGLMAMLVERLSSEVVSRKAHVLYAARLFRLES
jgi:hypothetical protein